MSHDLNLSHTFHVSHDINVSHTPVDNCISGFFQLRSKAEDTTEYRKRLLLFSDVFFVRCKLKYNFVFFMRHVSVLCSNKRGYLGGLKISY